MKSRTRNGLLPHAWSWFGRRENRYWDLRRVTSRYILMIPSHANSTILRSNHEYVLIRFPDDPEKPACRCGHGLHPDDLCKDKWCMCTRGEDEDGEYVP